MCTREAPGEKVGSGRVPPEDTLTGTRGRLGASRGSDEELRVELALSTLQTRQGNKTCLWTSTRERGQWRGRGLPCGLRVGGVHHHGRELRACSSRTLGPVVLVAGAVVRVLGGGWEGW